MPFWFANCGTQQAGELGPGAAQKLLDNLGPSQGVLHLGHAVFVTLNFDTALTKLGVEKLLLGLLVVL